jgi:hypothetical protein
VGENNGFKGIFEWFWVHGVVLERGLLGRSAFRWHGKSTNEVILGCRFFGNSSSFLWISSNSPKLPKFSSNS